MQTAVRPDLPGNPAPDIELTEAAPPQRAVLAVALAPVFVLLALTLVIGDLIAPHVGLAGVLVSVAWLVLELHRYEHALADDELAIDEAWGAAGGAPTELLVEH